MGRLAVDHRSSLQREQSLLRGFSTIQRPRSDPTRNRSSGQSDDTRQGKAMRRKSCHSPTGVAPGTANTPAGSACDTGMRAKNAGQDGSVVDACASGLSDEEEQRADSRGSNAANDAPLEPSNRNENTPADQMCEIRKNLEVAVPPSSVEEVPALPFFKSSPEKERRPKGYRRGYNLGDVVRSPSHMIVQPTDGQAFRAASSLDFEDFAFVQRSDGSFSYAILVHRSMEHIQNDKGRSIVECMTFVVSGVGATKKVARGNWGKYVRLVSMAGAPPKQQADIEETFEC